VESLSLCTLVCYIGAVISRSHYMFFPELLKDEISEYDLVGPTLPALKSMLDIRTSSSGVESYAKLIHGLVSCCLQNVEETMYVLIESQVHCSNTSQWTIWTSCDYEVEE